MNLNINAKLIRRIIVITVVIAAVIICAIIVLDSIRIKKRQSIEIKKKFIKDSSFMKDDLTDLPLLYFENDNLKKDYFLILISGDGGWRDYTNSLAKYISKKGVYVVGFNTIPYFDSVRSPARIAKDLQRVIRNFSHVWKKNNVMIGGYSFGAEILPFVYNAFDEEFKNRIKKLFLIAPSVSADFKVSRIYYYDPKKSQPVLPELLKTDKEKFIIFCDNQGESLCKILPDNAGIKTIFLNTGHLFFGKHKEVSETIFNTIIE